MLESIITLISVTALLLGSPGPAPLALAGVSAAFGIRNGIPFLLGVLCGLAVAILGAVLGLAVLFESYPNAKIFLQIIGGLYILYVAYKIASAPVLLFGDQESMLRPTFLDGFILNLLNPKAYAAFLAIFSQFALPLDSIFMSYFLTGLVCLLVATFVDAVWLCVGGLIRPLFHEPRKARILRVSFALLMVLTVLWAFLN